MDNNNNLQILKRLEILKNYILLEDFSELNGLLLKLKKYDANQYIFEIINEVENENYSNAVTKIQNFLTTHNQLVNWEDPVIEALKIELKYLEDQIHNYDNERIELEKLLSDFQYRHSIELGEILLKILSLRKAKFKNDKVKFEEAEKDEEEYKSQFEEELEKELFDLNDEQAKELKKKFRKATTLCHPDKFANEPLEIQKQAEAIFKELNDANSKNDLDRVSEILRNLGKGILKFELSDSINDKDVLMQTIQKHKLKLEKLKLEIDRIKQSEAYKTISVISDWEAYFKETKEKLKIELEVLKREMI